MSASTPTPSRGQRTAQGGSQAFEPQLVSEMEVAEEEGFDIFNKEDDLNHPFLFFRVNREVGPEQKALKDKLKNARDPHTGLINPAELNIDMIMRAWHEENAVFMATSTMQFVSTVAGFLDDPAEKLLLDEFRQLVPFFNSYKSDVPGLEFPKVTMKDANWQNLIARLKEYVAAVEALQKNRSVEFQKMWYNARVLAEIYFSPTLAAHCRQAVDSIKVVSREETDYNELWYYLIRHTVWMSRFAKLVAAGINRSRKKKYIYTKKFQIADAQQEYSAALDQFIGFSVKEEIRIPRPEQGNMYKKKFTIESQHPAVQRELREERYANVNI